MVIKGIISFTAYLLCAFHSACYFGCGFAACQHTAVMFSSCLTRYVASTHLCDLRDPSESCRHCESSTNKFIPCYGPVDRSVTPIAFVSLQKEQLWIFMTECTAEHSCFYRADPGSETERIGWKCQECQALSWQVRLITQNWWQSDTWICSLCEISKSWFQVLLNLTRWQ